MTGPDKPAGEEGPGADDTLPASSGLGVVAPGEDAPTVVTPRSHRPGSDVTALSDVGHAETVSGNTPHSGVNGLADQVLVAVGTLLGKRYRIGEHLGSGGMGTVYAAHDLLVDQAVALKFVRPSLASDHRERERLRAEVRLAQSVTHVNVARTYTLDELDNHLFIVMELLRGQTLSARLREGPLEVGEALRIARDLLHGLAAAHGRGILHRDIKPGNVKLAEDGRAVIMDFGMARVTESTAPASPTAAIEFEKLKVQITHTMLGGTPGYIAPEILRGRRGDARADLYSFGVMLYEMLAGRAPFAYSTPQELLVKHLVEEPAAIRTLRPEVPASLGTLVASLLAKEPDDRPHSAEAVRKDLEGALRTMGGTRPGTPLPVPRSATPAAGVPAGPSMESAESTARGLVVGAPRHRALWWIAAGVLVGGGVTLAVAAGVRSSAGRTEAPPVAASLPDAAAAAVAVAVPDAAPVADAAVAAPAPDAAVAAAPAAAPAPAAAKPRRPARGAQKASPEATKPTPPPQKPNPDDPAAEKRRRQLELED